MLDNPNQGAPSADDLDLELAVETGDKAAHVAPAEKTEAAIPDKYKNKSLDDLIRMNEDAQREISRKGNEISEVRRLADQLIGMRPEDNARKPERKPVTVETLLDNPETVIRAAIESAPVVKRTEEVSTKLDSLERKIAYGEFARNNPTFNDDIKDPAFIEWVAKNPLRSQLAQRADKFDFEAANNLWSLWGEHKELVGTAGKAKQGAQKAQAAATVKNGAAAPTSAPVYSRAKLMELRSKAYDGDPAAEAKLNDPEFNARLTQAYAEGRVR